MKNRVTVEIAGQELVLLSEEEPFYVRQVAAMVEREYRAVASDSRTPQSYAFILACFNLADRLSKLEKDNEHLRDQIRTSLSEAQKIRQELSEARRETYRGGAGIR